MNMEIVLKNRVNFEEEFILLVAKLISENKLCLSDAKIEAYFQLALKYKLNLDDINVNGDLYPELEFNQFQSTGFLTDEEKAMFNQYTNYIDLRYAFDEYMSNYYEERLVYYNEQIKHSDEKVKRDICNRCAKTDVSNKYFEFDKIWKYRNY